LGQIVSRFANTITWRPGERLNQLLVWSINDQNQLVLEGNEWASELAAAIPLVAGRNLTRLLLST
jgi:hypothetical protein